MPTDPTGAPHQPSPPQPKYEPVLALVVPAWSSAGEEESSRKVSHSGELWKCFGEGLCADKTPTQLVGSPRSKDFVAWSKVSISGDLTEQGPLAVASVFGARGEASKTTAECLERTGT